MLCYHCKRNSIKFITINDKTICNRCYHELCINCYKRCFKHNKTIKCKFILCKNYFKCYNCFEYNRNNLDNFSHKECHKYKFDGKYNNILII